MRRPIQRQLGWLALFAGWLMVPASVRAWPDWHGRSVHRGEVVVVPRGAVIGHDRHRGVVVTEPRGRIVGGSVRHGEVVVAPGAAVIGGVRHTGVVVEPGRVIEGRRVRVPEAAYRGIEYARLPIGYRTFVLSDHLYYGYPQLPVGYRSVVVSGVTYYVVGDYWLQPFWQEGALVYMVVPRPV